MSFKETLDLYSSLILNSLTKGRKIKKDYLDGMSVNTSYDRIVTKKSFKKVINLYHFDMNYLNNLESLLFEELYENCPRTRFRFVDYGKACKIDVTNDGLKNDFNRAVKQYEHYNSIYKGLNTAKKHTGERINEGGRIVKVDTRYMEVLRSRAESYEYIFDYMTKGGFSVYFKHLELMAEDNDELEKTIVFLQKILRREKVDQQILVGELGDYLMNFSPSGYKLSNNTKSVAMLLSDENISAQCCYGESGIVGDDGIPIGENLRTHSPQMFNATKCTGGVVNGVVAVTGGGKSAFVKNALQGHLGIPTHYVNIMDYKGGEYSPWLKVFNGVEIKLKHKYVNFLNISGIPEVFSHEERKDFYDTAIDGTCTLFEAMVNLQENEGNFVDLEKLIREATIKVYNRHGIERELVYTYELSKDAKYSEILEVMNAMQRQSHYTPRDKELLGTAISRCREFLDSRGSKANQFKEEIQFSEVLESRLVIYNFGKNQDNVDFTVEDNIKFCMMNFLNNKKTVYIKKKHCYNVLIYEELQRSGDGYILRAVNHDVTGGRSDNKIVYLLFNSLNFLGNAGRDAQGVAGNITNLFVGKLNKGEYTKLRDMFDTEVIDNDIKMIMDEPDKYSKCFAVKLEMDDFVKNVLVRVNLPDEIMGSELFHTRDTEKTVGGENEKAS